MTNPSLHRVQEFIAQHDLDAEILSCPDGVPTVEMAAAALGVPVDRIVKTLVFASSTGQLVIAIACGLDRVDRSKLAKLTGASKLKLASAQLVLDGTGYPPGGVAPVDLPSHAIVIVDRRVLDQPIVYGGSGTDLHMMRIRPQDIVRLNDAITADILQSSPT